VNADPESVVAWWFHRDRWTERLALIEKGGAIDLASTQTRESGMFVRTLRYKSAQGGEFDHRMEANLDESGKPPYEGDRYLAESRRTGLPQ
jgi:hypothetical protein